jgi:hypothetical protein
MWGLTVAVVGVLVLVSCASAGGGRDAHGSPQPHVVRTPNFTPTVRSDLQKRWFAQR